jgi:hypothetical protein
MAQALGFRRAQSADDEAVAFELSLASEHRPPAHA